MKLSNRRIVVGAFHKFAKKLGMSKGWSKDPDCLVTLTSRVLADKKIPSRYVEAVLQKEAGPTIQDRKYELQLNIEAVKTAIQNMAHILRETLDEVDLEFEPQIHEMTRLVTDIDVSLGHTERLMEGWEALSEEGEVPDLSEEEEEEEGEEEKRDGEKERETEEMGEGEQEEEGLPEKTIAPEVAAVPRQSPERYSR